MAVAFGVARVEASEPPGWEFTDASQTALKQKPVNSGLLYMPCDEDVGDCPQDALYLRETLSPNWGAAVHVAAEAGFGYRLDNTGNAPFHSFIGSFVAQLLTDINAAPGWTHRFRFKTPGSLANGIVFSLGGWNLGNFSYHVYLNGTNLEFWLSIDGAAYTVYACGGLTVATSTDYEGCFGYKYVTNGTSELRINIGAAGGSAVNRLNVTNAIGPLYSTPSGQFHLGGAQGHLTQHYVQTISVSFLFDEYRYNAEQFPTTTYTVPTAPHEPYSDAQEESEYQVLDMDADGATVDMSELVYSGASTSGLLFAYRCNNPDSGAFSAFMTWANLLNETDPDGHYLRFKAKRSTASGALPSPVVQAIHVEFTADGGAPLIGSNRVKAA